MRVRDCWLWGLLALSAPLLFAQVSSKPPVLCVDSQKIHLVNQPPSRLELPVLNAGQRPVNAHVHVELLQPDDKVIGSKDIESSVAMGKHLLVIPWPIGMHADSIPIVYWWRLSYSITPAAGSDFPAQQGIVQLSEIISDLLRIQVASVSNLGAGDRFPLQVHVDDPRTGKAQSGVHLEAEWDVGDEKQTPLPLKQGKTDAHGNATFLLRVPLNIEKDPSIYITAEKGSWTTSKSIELSLRDRARITVATDKPIYQPGQVLHMRALAFGPDNRALARTSLKFTVSGEDSNDEFETEVRTSEFGVAQTDWEIPQRVQLGDYNIRVDTDERHGFGDAQVRISRYELPQFTVDPSTDKAFYLPGQKPQVEVKANYLFGQPVKRGTVRIVRDNGRKWNADKKKYESDQKEVRQGELDSAGLFTAKLDVGEDFDDLGQSDYQRYKDLNFAAYVTDLSTNRTEQKHFTLRISKDPLHIYVINNSYSKGQPLDCYVMTALPDGTPASVEVTASLIQPERNDASVVDVSSLQRLEVAHLHTNKYGVAHLHAKPVPAEYWDAHKDSSRVRLLFEAAGRRVGKASHTEEIWLRPFPYLSIRPVASLLREGESVIADVESSLPDQELFVDLLGEEVVLGWQTVELRHGHAHVEFSYDKTFRNNLTLVAYTPHSRLSEEAPMASAEVLFPELQDLNLAVHMLRTTYKPGESAMARFAVRSPDGTPTRGALGVVIYDKAVAERVRNDQEFGRYGFDFGGYSRSHYLSIAGTSYRDLLNRKLTGPVSPDLEMLARVILATGGGDLSIDVEGENFGSALSIFQGKLAESFLSVRRALDFTGTIPGAEYPRNLQQLRHFLAQFGVDFDQLRDPWGMPYRASFSTFGSSYVVEILSNGPDKTSGTADDFVAFTSRWQYFVPIGQAIDEATTEYARRTGDYIRDFDALARELRSRRGPDLATLRDPWGNPYSFKFGVDGPSYRITVLSAGPDGVFDSQAKHSSDDLVEWNSYVRYFQKETTLLDSTLANHFRQTGAFPSNEDEFRPVLQASGLAGPSLLDPWGRPYHFVFSESSRYSEHINVTDSSVYGGGARRVTTAVPVTQQVGAIELVSYGPKNDPNEAFRVAIFTRILAEQSSQDLVSQVTSPRQLPLTGSTGAISGAVTDPQGAVIAGAKVVATDSYTNQQHSVVSDSSGVYLLRNLPPGRYRVEIIAQGFKVSVIDAVPVTSSNLTVVDVELAVGEASSTIEVSAAAPAVETTSAQISSIVRGEGTVKVQAEQQAFTPRVRKYFPETLLWQPELITDSSGKAQLKFAMADNITTWKMSVIASTTSGKLGLAEKELRTFQPFFVDHEPPKILTQGDQIHLPVVLRNYLNRPQQVQVKLEQSPWFSFLSASHQMVEVPAGQDAIAQFSISADHSIHEGKERVTAANHDTGDAVERTVAVHPDGEDVAQTVAALLSGARSTLDVEFPANAIPGSIEAELKIYPNIASHLLDSLNALVVRPAGCAEQITSIAFASVVLLQFLHKAGQDDPETPGNPNVELAKRARKYVTDAYQRLSQLQAGNGGFPYWVNNQPDAAVTAYVLDFLVQASEYINVDSAMIKRAEQFLKSNQEQNGEWLRHWSYSAPSRDANLTALVTRVLAEISRKLPDEGKSPEVQQVLSTGMKFLENRIAEWNDPYVIGQYALAASMTGRAEYIGKAQTLLRRLAHEEGPGVYWNLEANTSPFYSWGSAGRLETTGLAVRALALLPKTEEDSDNSKLLNRGLLYLLNHKDRYGSWYSTQATVNVLRGLVDALPSVGDAVHAADEADIVVNGKPAATLRLPSSTQITGPITADISGMLSPGDNKVEVRRQNDGSPLRAQLFTTHYIPWTASQATQTSGFKVGETRALRLNVDFDHTQAEVGKNIQCTVEVERIGFAGYGMMLAEVGLPPGAEVDRESLEHARESFAVSEYDILPDRVILYIWPKAGGSKFSFNFKPRFAMNAAAAPSILYDYYNPDARATVAPARFVVH
ncbi:MAG TPA: alpha-2-macroglobulin family protein [Candidatus Angelobacter sp.]